VVEARAKELKAAVSDASLVELRRGWYLGEKSFGEKVLAALAGEALVEKKMIASVGGEAVKAHDEAEAERISSEGLALLGLPDDSALLAGRGRWLVEKAVIAAMIRKRTGAGNRWIAKRLGMGHEGSVTRAARWAREDVVGRTRVAALEKMLVLDYRD